MNHVLHLKSQYVHRACCQSDAQVLFLNNGFQYRLWYRISFASSVLQAAIIRRLFVHNISLTSGDSFYCPYMFHAPDVSFGEVSWSRDVCLKIWSEGRHRAFAPAIWGGLLADYLSDFPIHGNELWSERLMSPPFSSKLLNLNSNISERISLNIFCNVKIWFWQYLIIRKKLMHYRVCGIIYYSGQIAIGD